jgi:hypothetical protein
MHAAHWIRRNCHNVQFLCEYSIFAFQDWEKDVMFTYYLVSAASVVCPFIHILKKRRACWMSNSELLYFIDMAWGSYSWHVKIRAIYVLCVPPVSWFSNKLYKSMWKLYIVFYLIISPNRLHIPAHWYEKSFWTCGF